MDGAQMDETYRLCREIRLWNEKGERAANLHDRRSVTEQLLEAVDRHCRLFGLDAEARQRIAEATDSMSFRMKCKAVHDFRLMHEMMHERWA